MSEIAVRAALETQLVTITPAIATAFENLTFTPPALDVPYQAAYVLFATPWNPEMGTGFQIVGYLQVTLRYPLLAGSGAAAARALAIRAAFQKNASFVSGGVVVTIDKTAAIGNGMPDAGRWALPVKVPFHANIFT